MLSRQLVVEHSKSEVVKILTN